MYVVYRLFPWPFSYASTLTFHDRNCVGSLGISHGQKLQQVNVRQSLRRPRRLFHHQTPDNPPPFSDQNTISSPQAAADREEPLKLQQIARILENVTEPILTRFQISHFQEQSQFWRLVATALSAEEGLICQNVAILWVGGGWRWRR